MKFAVLLLSVSLSGCAYNVTMMSRTSGAIYQGELNSNGNGTGSMSVNVNGVTCSGPVVKVASGESFGLATTYAKGQTSVTTAVMEGDSRLKGLLSCSNGGGLRCELTGRGSSGGGVCVDDKGTVLDVVASRK